MPLYVSRDGTLARLGMRPTVTSPLERSGRWSPYHRNGNSCSSFAWCSSVDCFIHENGNCDAVVTTRKHARDSAHVRSVAETELASRGRNPTRPKTSPSHLAWSLAESTAASAMPSRGEVPREGKYPRRGEEVPREVKNPREARQAWRAWSLVKSSEECRGPWRAGPWYPGFHCADRQSFGKF